MIFYSPQSIPQAQKIKPTTSSQKVVRFCLSFFCAFIASLMGSVLVQQIFLF